MAAKARKDAPDPDLDPAPDPEEGPAGEAGAPQTFERRLEALEQVVEDLEGEDLPLEASLQRYREGVEHLKACRSLLDDAERRLAELVSENGPGGEVRVTERPLKVGDKGLVADEERPKRGRAFPEDAP